MIKKIFNTLIQFIQKSIMTLVSLIRILIYSHSVTKLRELKNKNNLQCCILGTGPSLKNALSKNLVLLQSCELFVVNDFAKSEHYEILKPKYYILADPCYWDNNMNKDFYDAGISLLNIICNKTNWPIYLIIPNAAFKTKIFKEIFDTNRNIILLNYNTTTIKGFDKLNYFFYRNYIGMPLLQNVLIACIYLAINMRFSVVNILGADHSWTQDIVVNEKNEVCHTDKHFYDKENIKYFPFKKVSGEMYKMHEILRDYAQMFEGYHDLKKYADSRNVRIYNRTKGSFIDAFERVNI